MVLCRNITTSQNGSYVIILGKAKQTRPVGANTKYTCKLPLYKVLVETLTISICLGRYGMQQRSNQTAHGILPPNVEGVGVGKYRFWAPTSPIVLSAFCSLMPTRHRAQICGTWPPLLDWGVEKHGMAVMRRCACGRTHTTYVAKPRVFPIFGDLRQQSQNLAFGAHGTR